MVGGRLRHSDQEMIEFLIFREVKEWGQQNCFLGLLDGRLQPRLQFRRLIEQICWEAVLRCKGVLDLLQEGNLECTGSGHLHVPIDELIGKTSPDGHKALVENQNQKVQDLWNKRQTTQKDYKKLEGPKPT
ncbi:hypothetical protein BTVI_30737 [Pitangus sulphuratus]|nr:hypothetical protein BTVI_30737 [Pitangus sulphuratus]